MNIKNFSSSIPIDTDLLSFVGRTLMICRQELREFATLIPVYLLNNIDYEKEIDSQSELKFEINKNTDSAPSTELLGCYCYEWPIFNLPEQEKIFLCPERINHAAMKYCNGDYQGLFMTVLLHEYSHAAMAMNFSYELTGKFTWITESMANVGALEALESAVEKNIINSENFKYLYNFCTIQPAAYHLGAILSQSKLIKNRWVNANDVWNGDFENDKIFPSIQNYFSHSNPFGNSYPNRTCIDPIIQDYEKYFN